MHTFWNLFTALYPNSRDPMTITVLRRGVSAQWQLDQLIQRASVMLEQGEHDQVSEFDNGSQFEKELVSETVHSKSNSDGILEQSQDRQTDLPASPSSALQAEEHESTVSYVTESHASTQGEAYGVEEVKEVVDGEHELGLSNSLGEISEISYSSSAVQLAYVEDPDAVYDHLITADTGTVLSSTPESELAGPVHDENNASEPSILSTLDSFIANDDATGAAKVAGPESGDVEVEQLSNLKRSFDYTEGKRLIPMIFIFLVMWLTFWILSLCRKLSQKSSIWGNGIKVF
jgi:hypothetical protein